MKISLFWLIILFAVAVFGEEYGENCNETARIDGVQAVINLRDCIINALIGNSPECEKQNFNGPTCLCETCPPLMESLMTHVDVLNTCYPYFSFALYGNLTEFPCLVRPNHCTSLEACTTPKYLVGRGYGPAGKQTQDMCLSAVQRACDIYPEQPMCLGTGYSVNVVQHFPQARITRDISVYELMCDPTSRLSSAVVGSIQPAVVVGNNGRVQVNILPSLPAYSEPPVVWVSEGCTNSQPNGSVSVAWAGSMTPCLLGLQCDFVDGHVANVQICPSGFYCPNPTGPPVPCPIGSYCPMASIVPQECGKLSICSTNARVQLVGAIAVGVVLLAVIIAVILMKVMTYRSVRRTNKCKPTRDILGCENSAINSINPEPQIVDLPPPTIQLTISFSNIQVVAPQSSWFITNCLNRLPLIGAKAKKAPPKLLLNNVSGEFQHGKVTAIMGPSGAGKTTLLRSLLGRLKINQGSILINGQPCRLEHYRHVIGLVPQDDIMVRTLTVMEVLTHSAAMRLPADWTTEQRTNQVMAVVNALGLLDVCHTIVGDEFTRGISGGERRRCSIGIELVANPSVLFLDEPTTGLDSKSALECMEYLSAIATTGRTVVAIIHQPRHEIFLLLHSLLLLSNEGSTAYVGPTNQALDHFKGLGIYGGRGNPADQLMDVVNGRVLTKAGMDVSPKDLCDWWQQISKRVYHDEAGSAGYAMTSSLKTLFQEDLGATVKYKAVGFPRQMYYCCKRQLTQRYHSPVYSFLFLLVHAIAATALGVGFVANDLQQHWIPPLPEAYARFCPLAIRALCHEPLLDVSLTNALFFTNLALAAAGIAASVHSFGDELAIYRRERDTGTGTCAYFIGKSTAELPWVFIGALVFGGIFVPMWRPFQQFWGILWVLVGIEYVAWGIGYFQSVLINMYVLMAVCECKSAGVVGVVLVYACCVCSGLSPLLSRVYDNFSAARILWDLSFARYSNEALFLREVAFFQYPITSFSESTTQYIEMAGYKGGNYGFDVAMLFVLGTGYRALACLILHLKNGRI